MPYTTVSNISNVRRLNNYLEGNGDGKGHNGKELRNLDIVYSGFVPDSVIPLEKQFAALRKGASSQNKVDGIAFIFSFSADEANPNSGKAVRNMTAGVEGFFSKYYSGFPYAMYVQNDGAGGKLHIHAVMPNVNSVTFKAIPGIQRSGKRFVIPKFDRYMEENGYLPHAYQDYLKGKTNKVSKSKKEYRALQERSGKWKSGKPEYSWILDLKDRITDAERGTQSFEEFQKVLKRSGVTVQKKMSATKARRAGMAKGAKLPYLHYRLDDTSGFYDSGRYSLPKKIKVPNNLSARAFAKLGEEYDIEAVTKQLELNRQRAEENRLNALRAAQEIQEGAAEKKKGREDPDRKVYIFGKAYTRKEYEDYLERQHVSAMQKKIKLEAFFGSERFDMQNLPEKRRAPETKKGAGVPERERKIEREKVPDAKAKREAAAVKAEAKPAAKIETKAEVKKKTAAASQTRKVEKAAGESAVREQEKSETSAAPAAGKSPEVMKRDVITKTEIVKPEPSPELKSNAKKSETAAQENTKKVQAEPKVSVPRETVHEKTPVHPKQAAAPKPSYKDSEQYARYVRIMEERRNRKPDEDDIEEATEEELLEAAIEDGSAFMHPISPITQREDSLSDFDKARLEVIRQAHAEMDRMSRTDLDSVYAAARRNIDKEDENEGYRK